MQGQCFHGVFMADIWSKQRRSEVMSRVRSRGNKTTELRLIQMFKRNGIFGWRRRVKLLGSPDFVFRAPRLCVFVDGCFWHRCPRCYSAPVSNACYWDEKIRRTVARDRRIRRKLRNEGWCILPFWVHDLSKKNETK